MKTVGERIRLERQRQRMTLESLSKGTGLSVSYLSQLERNLTQASVTSIKKVARHLGIGVVKFFEENAGGNQGDWGYMRSFETKPVTSIAYSKGVAVIRAGKRKGITLPGSKVIYEILTPDLNRQLEVMYMRTSEGDSSGDEPIIDPPGEKFGLVISGTIEVRTDNGVYQLETGDSICFPSDGPHSWRGIEGDPIEVVWVLTPPSF